MSKNILVIGLIVIVAAILIYSFSGRQDSDSESVMSGDSDVAMKLPTSNHEGADEMLGDGDVAMSEEEMEYQGRVWAGNLAKLLDFNEEDYQRAVKSDKLIALYFYANWCPICKVEFLKMGEAFDALTTDEVIGFRVNFNDNETSRAEEDLAREFGVAYQHTKVFVKSGERILKSPESWEESRYLSEIKKFVK